MTGVQLGGAIKKCDRNWCGYFRRYGIWRKCSHSTDYRGIAEITRLGISLGANTNTFMECLDWAI